ncbi:hypothetical protein M5K25_012296 [Dendrobium thyrsiflorum]|uniref:Pentatricopeptide repeat-containing protein n=1 Tax=Dendrobium thyrsiflorum TaxID=117978 RepID=A0ABD0UX79_DENTH
MARFMQHRFAVQNTTNSIFGFDNLLKARCYSKLQIIEKEDELVPTNVLVRSIASIVQKTDRWDTLLKELCVASASKITPPIAVQVLKRIKKPEVAFKFFSWLDNQQGFSHDSLGYSAIIQVLAKDRNPSHTAIADSLLHKKIDLGLVVIQADYDHVLHQWAVSRSSDVALSLFNEMISHGFSPSAISCRVLLEELFRSKQEDLAWELFNNMLNRKINVLHADIFNVAMKYLCVKGKLEKALEIFTKMKAENYKPNLDSFNILIKGCCEKGEVKTLCELFKNMLDDEIKPNSYTMSLLIKELCKQGRPDYGNHLFNYMRLMGWIDRKFVYNQLVESLCNYGCCSKASKIFVKMVRRGHHPKPSLYGNLVQLLCTSGKLNEAFELKDLILRKAFLPGIDIYNGLINGLCLTKRMDLVEKLLVEIHEEGLEPDTQTFNIVLRGYCLSRNAKAAVELIERMKEEGFKPDMESYDKLANCLAADQGKVDEEIQVKTCEEIIVPIAEDSSSVVNDEVKPNENATC